MQVEVDDAVAIRVALDFTSPRAQLVAMPLAVAANELSALGARVHCEPMIYGAHVIVYSKDSEADRAFFQDVLQSGSVDAGGGWLIFALPPAELAVHPADASRSAYLLTWERLLRLP